jgi:hypothetical protein
MSDMPNGPEASAGPSIQDDDDEGWTSRAAKALDKVNANTNCAACGAFEWRAGSEAGWLPSLDSADGSEGYAVFVLVCANCGLIRHHLLDLLDPEPAEGLGPAEVGEAADDSDDQRDDDGEDQ